MATPLNYNGVMKIVSPNPKTIEHAIKLLKRGGVIAHPTDTCFGLAADAMNPEAVKRVQAIKGRDEAKPMSIMLPAMAMLDLEDYARLDGFTRDICNQLLPGPVTILLPKGLRIPRWYFPETDLIGIRVPYDPFTQDLLNAFKGPLVTTSANWSGKPVCCSHKEVAMQFKKRSAAPDLIFEGAMNPATCTPSTVILPEKGKIRITRPGAMKPKEIEGILGIKVVA